MSNHAALIVDAVETGVEVVEGEGEGGGEVEGEGEGEVGGGEEVERVEVSTIVSELPLLGSQGMEMGMGSQGMGMGRKEEESGWRWVGKRRWVQGGGKSVVPFHHRVEGGSRCGNHEDNDHALFLFLTGDDRAIALRKGGGGGGEKNGKRKAAGRGGKGKEKGMERKRKRQRGFDAVTPPRKELSSSLAGLEGIAQLMAPSSASNTSTVSSGSTQSSGASRRARPLLPPSVFEPL